MFACTSMFNKKCLPGAKAETVKSSYTNTLFLHSAHNLSLCTLQTIVQVYACGCVIIEPLIMFSHMHMQAIKIYTQNAHNNTHKAPYVFANFNVLRKLNFIIFVSLFFFFVWRSRYTKRYWVQKIRNFYTLFFKLMNTLIFVCVLNDISCLALTIF